MSPGNGSINLRTCCEGFCLDQAPQASAAHSDHRGSGTRHLGCTSIQTTFELLFVNVRLLSSQRGVLFDGAEGWNMVDICARAAVYSVSHTNIHLWRACCAIHTRHAIFSSVLLRPTGSANLVVAVRPWVHHCRPHVLQGLQRY